MPRARPAPWGAWFSRFLRPTTYVAAGFVLLIALGTVLLMLPIAKAGPGGASALTSLFTATSAVTVTGLSTVDTGSYWSGFGEVVLVGLVQIGGFGISTGAAVIAVLIFRRLGLRARMYTSTETSGIALGDVRRVVRVVAVLTVSVEVTTAIFLAGRWWLGYDEPFWEAVWDGIFHSVMAFNNAGLTLFSGSLTMFASDPWILMPISVALILGGIGVPVLYEVFHRTRERFSLHSKVTMWVSAVMIGYGAISLLLIEWENPLTFGGQPTPVKFLSAWFQSVSGRTAGFNTVDIGEMRPESLLVTDTLMFVGGGSVSTSGGIRVTTLAILFLVLWARARGNRDAHIAGRRIGDTLVQQALVMTLLFVLLTLIGTFLLLALSNSATDDSLFEVISALSTNGLSTGITGGLSGPAQLLLAFLMFVGRVGPITFATAIALRERDARYRYPEGRLLVG